MLSALVTDDLRCSGPKGDIVALLVAREHVLDEVAAGHERTLVREPDASTRRSRLLQCVRLPLSTNRACPSSSADVADVNAPCRAEIEVAPALDAPPVDLQMPAGLPADRADPPPASQPDGHDDRLHADADVDDRCAAQTQQPVQCRGDAHVVLLVSRLPSNSPQPARRGDGATAQNLRKLSGRRRSRAERSPQARTSAPHAPTANTQEPRVCRHVRWRA